MRKSRLKKSSCLGSTGSLPRTCCVALSICVAGCIRPATERHRLAACAPRKARCESSCYKELKRKAETEMKRAEILKLVWIRIDAIIETNRTNWQLIAQPRADRVAHVV